MSFPVSRRTVRRLESHARAAYTADQRLDRVPGDATDQVGRSGELLVAFREGPYDWEALEAFASEIVAKG